jgi:PPOX class probable F420-dependent enzyme
MRRIVMLSERYQALLERPVVGVLTTLMPDGSPQSSPVWFVFDGDSVLVSTTAQRVKHRNVRHDPRVSFTVVDPEQPLHYVELRGEAAVDDDPTAALRDRVARKHGYQDGAAFDKPGEQRVIVRLVPDRVVEH